jgi:Zn-dependent protease
MQNLYPIFWYLVFVVSVTLHEAAHAWAAKRGGDLTAYAGGQVSLNPVPHIKREPFGMLILPLLTAFLIGWPFGYARTPYDPRWAHEHPRKAAWMAAAGPAANLLLVVISLIIIQIGIGADFFTQPLLVSLDQIVTPASSNFSGLAVFISMLFSLNVILFILNIIPLPPLDGSSIIGLFLQDDTARSYKRVISNPAFSMVGLLLAWLVFTPLFNIIFPAIMNIIYWGAGYH